MILGFVMMQPPRREHSQSSTGTGYAVAAVPLLIVVLLTVLQVMLFTPQRASLVSIAHQSALGLIAP